MKVVQVPYKEVEDYTTEDFGGIRKNKTVCIVRYGAFGDIVQASSLFPIFKDKGYDVCVNVTPIGAGMLKSNPYVDQLIVQKDDQINNFKLGDYWKKMEECFDKFVQLSESVEGRLLLNPERDVKVDGKIIRVEASEGYHLSKEEIHERCDKNYLEETHRIAGVEFKHGPVFYPSPSEKAWAKKQRKKIKTKNVVLWSLSGSSVHKVYPWTDNVIAALLLKRPNTSIITVGDHLCQLLEVGWEKEKRVIMKAGKLPINKTLALLPHCDVIVGPETGVLNAASMLPNHKCVFLSHSSNENLTKHWKNTTAFEPVDCPCFPCHKLHFGFSTCNRDSQSGGALCASNIKPDRVVTDILRNLK